MFSSIYNKFLFIEENLKNVSSTTVGNRKNEHQLERELFCSICQWINDSVISYGKMSFLTSTLRYGGSCFQL